MKIQVETFLNQFDSNFRNEIVEFAKRITKYTEEYDVVIFLARKAVCLADCLNELELSNFNCLVTSSRVLDMNLTWLKNKKIAIIDDTLISGTSLYQIKQTLSENDITDVDFYVLAVDNEWWCKDLISPKTPYLFIDPSQVSLICSNIVDAIATVPRPYSIDRAFL